MRTETVVLTHEEVARLLCFLAANKPQAESKELTRLYHKALTACTVKDGGAAVLFDGIIRVIR